MPPGRGHRHRRAAGNQQGEREQRGLAVPHDISVIGFDDQEFIASELDPPLTTMRLPHAEMGKLAIQTLLGHDTPSASWQPNGTGEVARLECPLVRRASVTAVRAVRLPV